MSRVGKKAVDIPAGVKVEVSGQLVKASGPAGANEMEVHQPIKVKLGESGKQIDVINDDSESRRAKELHGTMRALIASMLEGVSKGFSKTLQVFGTGFTVNEQGGKLVFAVGYCKPVERKIPKRVKVKIDVKAAKGNEVPAVFTLSSVDKCELGEFAAEVRKIRPPEPYKGKGIRYADEQVKRKAGKAFTSGTA
jgi:large subunit ribosomal protein L6